MAEYQRYAQDPKFQVETPITRGDALAAKVQSDIQKQQQFYNSNRIADQQRIEASRFVGQDLQALAPFAQSITKLMEDVAKKSFKDIEIGEQYASIYNGDLGLTEEQQALILGQAENEHYGKTANELEAAGLINEAEKVRNTEMRLAKGVTNERALLYDARARYASDITRLVNSPELSQLYQADPAQALQIATKIWIENNKLQFTTKANFVGILGETIRNTNSYMATNATTELIKAQKEQTLAENDRQAYNSVNGITPTNAVARFQELSQSYLNDNNGIVTQAAANSRAAQNMINAAVAKSPEAVTIVLGAEIRPGEEKSSLGDTYPTMAKKAIDASQDETYKQMLLKRRTTIVNLGKALENAKTSLERQEAMNTALDSLGTDIEGRTQLQNKYADYISTDEQFDESRRILQELDEGRPLSPQQIAQKRANGEITAAQANTYITRLNQVTKSGQTAMANVRKESSTNFKVRLAQQVGFTPQPGGALAAIGTTPIVSRDKVNQISRAYDIRLQSYLKRTLYDTNKLRYDGTQSPAEQEAILQQASADFYKAQVLDPKGDFYFDGLFVGGEFDPDKDYSGATAKMNTFGSSVSNRNAQANKLSSGQSDVSSDWNPRSNDFTTIGTKYKPGDVLYDKVSLQQTVRPFRTQGINNGRLVQFAQKEGITPLQLVNDSALYHDEPEIKQLSQADAVALMGPSPGNVETPRNKATTYKAIPAFLAAGFTPQGAAAAAAYLYQAGVRYKTDYLRTTDYVTEFINRVAGANLRLFTTPSVTQRQLVRSLNEGIPYNGYGTDMQGMLTQFYGQ